MNETTIKVAADVAPVLAALAKWINQRISLDPANYDSDGTAYRSEYRSILKQRERARAAWSQANAYLHNAQALTEAFEAFSGRLQWNGKSLKYTTGQYYPTEFALAAAVVLERYVDLVRPKKAPEPEARFTCMAAIKQVNWEAGGHWFDRSNMKSFRSRILPKVYNGPGGVFFVSSEDSGFDAAGRRFTVRQFDPKNASIDTFGPFNKLSRGAAIALAHRAAAGEITKKEADAL